MIIENENFFLAINNPDTSGTFSFTFKGRTILEVDAKHSYYDWGKIPFQVYSNKLFNVVWIPHRINCIGWRILYFKGR